MPTYYYYIEVKDPLGNWVPMSDADMIIQMSAQNHIAVQSYLRGDRFIYIFTAQVSWYHVKIGVTNAWRQLSEKYPHLNLPIHARPCMCDAEGELHPFFSVASSDEEWTGSIA